MADDFEDDEVRPVRNKVGKKKKKPKGDQTLKIVLIVLGSLGGLTVLTCCGVGTWMYFSAKRALNEITKNAFITAPADIQNVVAEMTDITIPPEFVPQSASKLIGKQAEFQWCPTGTCTPHEHGLGRLRIETGLPGEGMDYSIYKSVYSDGVLELGWKQYTRAEHEFDIRGTKCKFYIVQGEAWQNDGPDDMAQLKAPPQQPVDPANRASIRKVEIAGDFPGKAGKVQIECHLSPEQYDEGKILAMLRSIR